MPRYGDLDKLEKELNGIALDYLADGSMQCNIAAGVVCNIRDTVIANAPTADVAPVVRCKDCKHLEKHGDCEIFDEWSTRTPEDFCSFGERKNDEAQTDT